MPLNLAMNKGLWHDDSEKVMKTAFNCYLVSRGRFPVMATWRGDVRAAGTATREKESDRKTDGKSQTEFWLGIKVTAHPGPGNNKKNFVNQLHRIYHLNCLPQSTPFRHILAEPTHRLCSHDNHRGQWCCFCHQS